MKNRRSDPARGVSCLQGSGEASAGADGKGKSTRAADRRKQKQKKKSRPSASVSGSDGRDIASGEIARSKHRRKLSRSTSPVSDAQEASGEASALAGGKMIRRMYSRQKKKSKTHKPAWRSFEVVDDGFAEGEIDTETQLGSPKAPEASTPEEATEASLVIDNATSTVTKISEKEASTPEKATEASPVIENAASTGTKISEKKSKDQATPTFGDLGGIGQDDGNSDRIAHAMDHEQEPLLECLDWDSEKLGMETQFYLDQLDAGPPDDDDDEFWAEYEEPELTHLKERLALHRIIAHQISKKKQPLDDADLKKKYTPQILKEQGYFEGYERSLEWYFCPEYCMYVGFQDYQRLVLRDTNEYHKWKHYREENNTYEADREFVKFYDKLASETKWIDTFLTDKKLAWGKINCIALYQAAKIATSFENIYRPLLYFCFTEFTWSVWFDYSFYKTRARLFFEIWKRVAKEKINFKDALKQIHEQDMFPSIAYEIKCELECSAKSGSMKADYDTYTAHIKGEVQEDKAFLLIMERIKKKVPKLKTYYDYVKKKLNVAESIRLIPPEI